MFATVVRKWALIGFWIGLFLGIVMTVLRFFQTLPWAESGFRQEFQLLCPVYVWGQANGYNDPNYLIAMATLGNAVVYGAAGGTVGLLIFAFRKIVP